MILPVIIIIILVLCMFSLYLSDTVSLRAYIQGYLTTESSNNKNIEDIKKELKKELSNYTYIADITEISVRENKNIIYVKININFKDKLMGINLKDSINVKFHKERSKDYIVKSKILIESVKNIGGVVSWK